VRNAVNGIDPMREGRIRVICKSPPTTATGSRTHA
jgi:hypothetical protein